MSSLRNWCEVLVILGPQVLSVVQSAWMDTLRLCRMGASLFLQNVATSSVASASVIPLRMLTLPQLVGKRSTISGTTPFMKCSELLRIDQWTDSQAGLSAWYLPPVSWAKKDFQKSMSDVNCSFVFQPLRSFCFSPIWCYWVGSSQVSLASLLLGILSRE